MPAKIGDIPLSHHVATRLDAKDIKNLETFSKAHGFKRCTVIRLALREYIAKQKPPVGQVPAGGSVVY